MSRDDSREVLVRVSKGEIELFKESLLWKDMKRELGVWKNQIKSRSLDIIGECINGEKDSGSTLAALGSLYGSVETVDFVLHMPDVLIDTIEMQKKDKEPSTK